MPDMPGRPTSVLIADDDPLARRVLRSVLVAAGIEVVAETASAREAVDLADKHRPDVVLLDAGLGDDDGIAVLRSLLDRAPGVRVLVLANSTDTEPAMRSLRCGANGYVARDIDLLTLTRVVQRVASGEVGISRQLTMELVKWLRDLPDRDIGTRPVTSPLTTREWEVLDLLCLQRSTASIADQLYITGETVRSHVKSILRKLGVSSRAEAVSAAHALRRAG